MTTKYPLELKRGDNVQVEGRTFRIHNVSFFEEERFGVLHNVVLAETSIGTQLSFRLGQIVEVA